MIEYGVAFVCNKKINDKALDIINDLAEFGLENSINNEFFSHITIYQGLIHEEAIDFLALEIKRIFTKPLILTTVDKLFFTNPISNIFLNIEPNNDLNVFHLSVLNLGKIYSNKTLRDSVRKFADNLKDLKLKNFLIENHGIYFGANYIPHITLFKTDRLIPEITKRIYEPIKFEVDTIVIGKINKNGQMSKNDVILRVETNN